MCARFALFSLWLFVSMAGFLMSSAFAQDPEAPCGRDESGYPLQCTKPDASADLEGACLTTGRIENCVPYHQNSCFVRGFQVAFILYSLVQNFFCGDQNTCN